RLRPQKIMDGISSIDAGDFHALAVGNDGTLWAWGWNGWGQLGDGSDVDRNVPVRVMTGVRQASAGHNRTAAVKTDGSLWVWGDHVSGYTRRSHVKMLDGVRQVSVGGAHILAVMADGRLMAWGWNSVGQLGIGTIDKDCWYNTPMKIMDGVDEACAGCLYSLVRRNDGSLWGWGCNDGGQLGIGNLNDQLRPVHIADKVGDFAAGYDTSLWITPAGELKITGQITNYDS
ncbi:MAG: RCC1 domain-containing protein, partial [Lepagella sp.]